jgi:3-hydroxyisobutyrate dehydrogenase-like beta-hydroxyacid dehydrogenase
MALRLLREGWQLSVVDRFPAKARPCVDEGAVVVQAVTDLGHVDVVAVAVPDDAAVAAVLEGPDGLLSRLPGGAVVLVHSTVLPETARRLAARGADRGLHVLDAPVSGGDERALTGELTVMVGGTAEGFAAARPLLESVGSDVVHVGPSGAGSATKLANQLMMFANLAGAHEALALAAAYGVDESAVLGAVRTGTGDSWVSRNWGFFDRVAAAYDTGGTPVHERSWSKDLWEVVAAARQVDVRVPVAGLLAQHLADRVEAHAGHAR